MAADDNDERPEQTEVDDGEPSPGVDELLYALSDALRSKRSKEAIGSLIERYAAEIPLTAKRRYGAMLWSYAFTLLIVTAIGALGWMKVVSNETAGALLGAVVGGIFYRNLK